MAGYWLVALPGPGSQPKSPTPEVIGAQVGGREVAITIEESVAMDTPAHSVSS